MSGQGKHFKKVTLGVPSFRNILKNFNAFNFWENFK